MFTGFLLLQQVPEAAAPTGIPWFYAAFYGGQTLLILIVLIYFAIKAMPTWERTRTRELDVRDTESKVMGQIAAALSQVATSNSEVASSLKQSSETTREIAVEQRKTTELLQLLERADSDRQEHLYETMKEINLRLKVVEGIKDERSPSH
jgi:hypothetical protein